ncbi:hypothetical protein A2716_03150 [candidate division WWE3 bacterium RIFCSPHIGHO2_01_FULL_40_23]|uniref:Uncharacterized protein n=1 Tax=candidate division WWE3 bacterium RIFCSPLOWO2_01_FULL_41_18 TaxID=1802625 RepID=A0A1F4VCA2_UNCKA|nr:MAG: hypothetical protein A2716_03150 [candidate division WWE3 bacterium RIFCSPHIGHO2_01_FULL_40_23]OGC54881.1 MAG: hypothetical protein A3A78_02760 [candidate division WWE3 bacterium RIFCSPLOWO2_01_FULL_41_18]
MKLTLPGLIKIFLASIFLYLVSWAVSSGFDDIIYFCVLVAYYFVLIYFFVNIIKFALKRLR